MFFRKKFKNPVRKTLAYIFLSAFAIYSFTTTPLDLTNIISVSLVFLLLLPSCVNWIFDGLPEAVIEDSTNQEHTLAPLEKEILETNDENELKLTFFSLDKNKEIELEK